MCFSLICFTPSCSSHPPPTGGAVCHTWVCVHSTDLCSHHRSSGFFLQTSDSQMLHPLPALWGCTTTPRQKSTGRSLSSTILGAFNGTIVMDSASGWFIDPVSSAKLWILKKLPVTSQKSPSHTAFLLRGCKWFLLCATGDFETIIDGIFVGVGNVTTTEPVSCVFVLNAAIWGCQGP